MKVLTIKALCIGLVIGIFSDSGRAQDVCSALSGAVLIGQDSRNTYLGCISSPYDAESIFNEYGTYGSKYNSRSIWNEYSTFGNEYGSHSPFNRYSSKPPMIIKGRQIMGYLTTNKYLGGAISPNLLKALCK